MRRGFFLLAAAILALLPACAPRTGSSGVEKAAPGTSLRAIQDRGKLIVGVKYDVPTFGYLNPRTNQLEGLDVDLGKAIAREILGSESAFEPKQAVSADRIPFLTSGQVDLILSTMTANEERAQQIDAIFTVESNPGAGTRITAVVPLASSTS